MKILMHLTPSTPLNRFNKLVGHIRERHYKAQSVHPSGNDVRCSQKHNLVPTKDMFTPQLMYCIAFDVPKKQ